MDYHFCVIGKKAKRVDMYISALFEDFSRSYVQKLIDRGHVFINGKAPKKNVKLIHKDEVLIKIYVEEYKILAENIPLDIVYEDNEMIIINKESGINVHPVPGEGGNSGTLVNAILWHCKNSLSSCSKKEKEENNLPCINGEQRPGIVHRLDKGTSGLIMIAKNDAMMHYLSEIIKKREIEKHYIAIVYGMMKDTDISIESYIGRDKHNRQKMTTNSPVNPKLALTKVKVIDYIDNKYSLLRVKLETGRTHQIRVHLASIGFPIIGDQVYGNSKANIEAKTRYQIKRQALHAQSLSFKLGGEVKKFVGPLKSDMIKMIGDIKI